MTAPAFEIVTGAAAQADILGLPANVLLYGTGGLGKTTDAVAAFCKDGRCNAFVIPCEDGGLKGPAARGLPVPDHPRSTVKSWEQMKYTIAWLSQYRQNYSAVIVDGLSTLTNYMYREATETIKPKNKWDIPVFVRNNLFYLREWIRALGLHSVFVGHALPPAVVDGIFYPGSPLMQPKSMINDYYGLVDTVLRVDYVYPAGAVPGATVAVAPVRAYYTGGEIWNPQFMQPPDYRLWRAKNREGCNNAIVPADLSGFLRSRQPPYGGL